MFMRLLLCLTTALHAAPDAAFDAAVSSAAGPVAVRATVILADQAADGALTFRSVHYKDEPAATDFWPASTIKLYAVIAALELAHAEGFGLDAAVTFERKTDGRWITDCARTLREMLSETFIRSSNEDYTLLLRMSGIDRINTALLTAERGFARSALMRGYVTRRPYVYNTAEPQRITLQDRAGKTRTLEHTWSGRSYSEERGATVISAKTGNVTTTAEMAECLRRVMFHERLAPAERYRVSDEMAAFLRCGGDGFTGLEVNGKDSGAYAWEQSGALVYPKARYFHKCGRISNYVLDLACLDDRPASGRAVILAVSGNTGDENFARTLSKAVLEWAKAQPPPATP
jgi:Beta-lactamase enzyme family